MRKINIIYNQQLCEPRLGQQLLPTPTTPLPIMHIKIYKNTIHLYTNIGLLAFFAPVPLYYFNGNRSARWGSQSTERFQFGKTLRIKQACRRQRFFLASPLVGMRDWKTRSFWKMHNLFISMNFDSKPVYVRRNRDLFGL